ncbi:hypothetical protein QSH18_04060 [Xanthomonas sp. NCPPB 2654]|uniref:hypothetical protein n=1 Tax=unclassified Xanthomonas TaxID=2643310 RepID=UPI0021E00594|nr:MULTISPECIES: hypothetical protein [unclassified Xanthomonas]MDL5364773.1 hypothetical protein [Xanthomonas sp. NCPPB 2654]MDR6671773.1 putative membrane protein [Xanthomonas translucens]MEB1530440.1 hypothetical protein [Xanthomonas campestris pv. campestris]UYC22083.1 hypothetical protein NUG20_07265 [Xanthomonas sp. CFBP 8443]
MSDSPVAEHLNALDGTRMLRTVSILGEPHRILDAWCDMTVQQQILHGLAELQSGDGYESQWRLRLPLDRHVALRYRRGEVRMGESVRYAGDGEHGLQLQTELSVRPAPNGFGCEAVLAVEYRVEGGPIAQAVAKLVGAAPDAMVAKVLRRFKAWIECGEVPTLRNNPSARARDHHQD